jgi:pilus assembly protein CpaF
VNPLQVSDLVELKSLTQPMAQMLQALAHAKINVLVSGGTGSGKTTLLNILSGFIPEDERVVTIEDAAELQLRQPHVLRLETRPPNIEGKGNQPARAGAQRAADAPDRIILGEMRGGEALDMLNAMNTGHEGSLTTIHANTPRDALTRLENMVSMAGLTMPASHAPADRLGDHGDRAGGASDRRAAQDHQHPGNHWHGRRHHQHAGDLHVPAHGCGRGWHGPRPLQATGVYPKFAERLRVFGVGLPDETYVRGATKSEPRTDQRQHIRG